LIAKKSLLHGSGTALPSDLRIFFAINKLGAAFKPPLPALPDVRLGRT
jgi:hypothetical protein